MKIRFDVSYAYSPRESAIAQGNNHIRVIDPVSSGRLVRKEYQALCKTSFWGLMPVHNAKFGHVCPKCAAIKARLEAQGYEFEQVEGV